MNLGEIVDRIEEFEDHDYSIYAAKPWTVDSEARVELGDGTTGPQGGLDYLLDIGTAQDVIQTWSEHRDGVPPTTAERCEAVVYYEAHDCFLIPDDDDSIS